MAAADSQVEVAEELLTATFELRGGGVFAFLLRAGRADGEQIRA